MDASNEKDCLMRRKLATTNSGTYTFQVNNLTYTCVLTQKANTFGGTSTDTFADVTVDSNGIMFAVGNTYST